MSNLNTKIRRPLWTEPAVALSLVAALVTAVINVLVENDVASSGGIVLTILAVAKAIRENVFAPETVDDLRFRGGQDR